MDKDGNQEAEQREHPQGTLTSILFEQERPRVRTAVVYAVEGTIPEAMRAGLIGGFAAVGAGYSTALVPTSLDTRNAAP